MKIKKIDSSCIRVGLTFRPDIKGFPMLRCIYHDTDCIHAVSVKDGKIYRITPGLLVSFILILRRETSMAMLMDSDHITVVDIIIVLVTFALCIYFLLKED